MSATGYIKFYPSDFLNGIIGLSANEITVYVISMMMQYDQRKPIRNNLKAIAARCSLRPSTVTSALQSLVDMGKLIVTDEGISNPRATREIEILTSLQRVSHENGTKVRLKLDKMSNKINGDHNLLGTQQVHKPEARSQKPEATASAVAACATKTDAQPRVDQVRSTDDPMRTFLDRVWPICEGFRAAMANAPGMVDYAPVLRWISAGAELELDIIPAVIEWLSKPRGKYPRTWNFFDPIIAEYRQNRLGSPLAAVKAPEAPKSRLDENGRIRPSASGLVSVADRKEFGVVYWYEPHEPEMRNVWLFAIDRHQAGKGWNREDLGPAPGEDGCVCPEDLVRYVTSGDWDRDIAEQRRQDRMIFDLPAPDRTRWDDQLH